MKKLLSVVLVLSFCLCLGGCVLPWDSGTQNCISGNPGSYVITLPKTGQTIDVGADEEIYQKMYHDNLLRFLGLKQRDFVHTSPVPDDANSWAIGTERASAAPIRYAKAHYEGDFSELLPVLDAAYDLYRKDDVTLCGDAKTDLLAGLLRAYRKEAKGEE